MGFASLRGKLRRFSTGVLTQAREQGLRAGLALGKQWLSQFAERQAKAIYTRVYDARMGVDTRPDGPHEERPTNALHLDAVYYDRVNPVRFRRVMDSLEIHPEHHTFIDLGCGKGAALLLALHYGFTSVVGVELNERLCRIAQDNVRTVIDRRKPRAVAHIVTHDAADYAFPRQPIVLFLYNPFGPDTLRAVLKNLEASLRESPRDVRIAYTSPWHGEVLEASDLFEQIPGSAYRWGAAYQSVSRAA